MPEDEQRPVDRNTLYEEVWAEPVKIVAERYGLSDVGLAKLCRKLEIPVPSRGYWAKVKAGRIMRKVPLKPLSSSALPRPGPTPLSPEQREKRAAIKQTVSKVTEVRPKLEVPPSLLAPHPLVRAAEKRLKQREGWGSETGLRSAPKEVLNLDVSRASLDRALRLVDTLLKALEVASVAVQIDHDKGKTVLHSNGTQVDLAITEKVTRTQHVLTLTEKRARDRYHSSFRSGIRAEYPHIPRFDYHATGRLTISVRGWPARNWNDTPHTSLDDRMNEVVSGVVALIEEVRAREAEMARKAEERRLAQVRYENDMRRRENERKRLGALRREAACFRRARELRDYIAAVEDAARRAGELSPERLEWIDWARAKADWIDPLNRISDVVLDSPEPKRPSLW